MTFFDEPIELTGSAVLHGTADLQEPVETIDYSNQFDTIIVQNDELLYELQLLNDYQKNLLMFGFIAVLIVLISGCCKFIKNIF